MGALPPPVMGLSAANAAMIRAFGEAGARVTRIDTAPRSGPGLWNRARATLGVRARALAAVARLGMSRSPAALYAGLSGGRGQIFDMAAFLIARLAGLPLTVHHHSFAYLDRRSRLASLTFYAAGGHARHVVLGAGMAERLTSLYPQVTRVEVMSNAALSEIAPAARAPAGPLRRLGFLSNVTMEKGIGRFVDLLAELRRAGLDVDAVVAGPLMQDEAARIVRGAEADGLLRHVGAVSGTAKADFLSGVDVLVLPSLYINEAEPLVLLEAMAMGLPVIASSRGCIPGMIADGGCLLDRDARDLSPAITRIADWLADPAGFDRARQAALDHARERAERSHLVRRRLIGEIMDESSGRRP
jgi:glycosyltransferase involved in cell wall biosynthesis